MESWAAAATSAALADEIRVEMARQRRTGHELAVVLGITAHTAGRRLSGATPFDVVELARVGRWLAVDPATLLTRARERSRGQDSEREDQPAA
ncbi:MULTISPECIES: helix-turn-helix domain-containing protein [unclassified Microbacterium]|uniref:helix-turn-helix domain-containing protein n=1 Tax=unclassified Microbacterium TaxID=2609290 RepID=UPI0030174F4E